MCYRPCHVVHYLFFFSTEKDRMFCANKFYGIIAIACTIIFLNRFGSFEIFKTRDATTGRIGPSVGRIDIFHLLLDYVTKHFYPEVCVVVLMFVINLNTCTCTYIISTCICRFINHTWMTLKLEQQVSLMKYAVSLAVLLQCGSV